uniref:Negative regulator of systemic acquired resistance SNI1 n=1 Tax=Opuntia streptacantha TaxID=393608 RepID=A0A7C9ERD3_OPUST
MDKSRRRAASNRAMEENTLAILDSFCTHNSSHVHDDRLAFLEAVRSASIVPENGNPPTEKMMEAVFEILREAKSLELIIASYKLLTDLEEHFPRVYLSDGDVKSSLEKPTSLVVIEEAWSPFSVVSDVTANNKHAANKRSKEPIDSAGFHLLLEGLTEVTSAPESSEIMLDILANMLLFQYLVNVLKGDFLARNQTFLRSSDWISLRECLLNKLLGSRRINYKGFVKDCLFTMCKRFSSYSPLNHCSGPAETSLPQLYNDSDAAIALALPEIAKSTHEAVQNLLVMMTNLDSSRKKADIEGLTTRTDGIRTPVMELILDTLSYDKDMISPFLQVFDEPKLKLEIVSQYFHKYTAKPPTRNQRSSVPQDDPTVTGFFKCFLNSASTKGIVKKIGAKAVQVLLAHALQACMLLPPEQLVEGISELNAATKSNPLDTICKNVISAFTRLKETDKNMEILPIGKEAVFTAATILSARK